MEENNNIIVKGLAITLIVILGLNVYRTETTKKEVSKLTTAVEQLESKLDSLGMLSPSGRVSYAGVNKKEFASLSKKVSSLESKVSIIQGSVDRLSHNQAHSQVPTTNSTNTNVSANTNKSSSTTAPTSSNGRVTVSAKARVENRYVEGTTYLPKVVTGPAGLVVLDLVITRIGRVTSVSIDSSSTIKDEDIVDACKDAALRTHFSYNSDAPEKVRGTITYTFKAQ